MLFAAAGHPLPPPEPRKGEPGYMGMADKWRAFTRDHNIAWKQRQKVAKARERRPRRESP